MGKPAEAADQSLWELMDSGQKAGRQNGTDLGSLHPDDSCVGWSFVGPLAVGPGLVPDGWADSLGLIS